MNIIKNSLFVLLTFLASCDSADDSNATNPVVNTGCNAIQASVVDAGFSEKVTVTCDSNYALLTSTVYPDHDLMNGITATNEQIPVPAKSYSPPVKLTPSGTSNTTTIDSAIAVAVNGVPIYDYSTAGDLDVNNYDSAFDAHLLGQLDNCGGHSGRGDDYHYHKSPTCMIENMTNKGDGAIIGWGYDGYPIYGNNNPDGSEITAGSLDVCNGKSDSTYGYRYHTSTAAPYVLKCLRGDIDESVLPRISPMNGRTSGTPPEGGVTGLKHTVNNGVYRLEYTYQSTVYYLQYSASATANCYNFETKTVTDSGQVKTGEFCRE